MELIVNIEKKLTNFTLKVSFQMKNEVLALLGPSGCGKSMTLKCIAGIETPDSGFISLNGRTLFDSKNKINLPPQQRKIGYLFQNYALFPNMTIRENISFVSKLLARDRENKTTELLRKFSLTEQGNSYPHQLSGGQQQRAALARILAADSELLMLDEPFSALDNYLKWQTELEFTNILKEYNETALLVSHDRGEVYRLADTIGVISQGQLETVKEKHLLFADPQTKAATLLTGCKNISAAQYIDEHSLWAEDWQIKLFSTAPVPHDIKFTAIRAHYMEIISENDLDRNTTTSEKNIFPMEIIQEIEDTFSYILMVRPADSKTSAPIRFELEKEKWQQVKSAHCHNNIKNILLKIPADKLILLTQ